MMILDFPKGYLIQVIGENVDRDSNLWQTIRAIKIVFHLTTYVLHCNEQFKWIIAVR